MTGNKKIKTMLFWTLLAVLVYAVPPRAGAETHSKRELTVTLSTIPEAMLVFAQHFVVPFLRGDSSLTADNNIETTLAAEL
ncbi:MAG: hypothetical protein LBQ55_00610, partial [Treponema sp.]|nr:hypothetical protein [Treponema sp.]